jgi:hypothetical protein
MPRDITYQIQAAIAEAIAHGATREQVEKLSYQMRQRAMMEEGHNETMDVPPDPPKAA